MIRIPAEIVSPHINSHSTEDQLKSFEGKEVTLKGLSGLSLSLTPFPPAQFETGQDPKMRIV